jgi:hypothetical protein
MQFLYVGGMTDEEADKADREALAEKIAEELRDSIGITTPEDRDLTARCLVASIEHDLRQLGWLPPAKTDRILGGIYHWSARLGQIPDHHLTRDVLNSHLAELAQILHDR